MGEKKNLPKGDRSGLFYLTMLGTVAEDYTQYIEGAR